MDDISPTVITYDDSQGDISLDTTLMNIAAANLLPEKSHLAQNYPNPFNPITVISYQTSINTFVELTVYNTLGKTIITLVEKNQPAGYYEIEWNGRDASQRDVAGGVYLLQLKAGNYSKTRKIILIR